jgi:methylated-DNA-[protein]-cysteine S-methyltransferase
MTKEMPGSAGFAYTAKIPAPFAVLGIVTDGRALTRLHYLPRDEPEMAPSDAIAAEAARQLERYLADPEFRFTVPLAPRGTAFQQRVWQQIDAIPLGQSRTYGEVARMVRSAPRAVGQACGANRIALIIPCHRVVGAQGAMGGFMNAGDGDPIAIKRWLLTHEGYRFGA